MTKPNPDPTPNASRPKPVDLADLDTIAASDEGTEIELTHPLTGVPLGIFWGVLGKHSQVFRDTMRERVNRRLSREALARKRGKDPETPTAEQAEAEAIELLTLCSTGWRTEAKDEAGKVVSNEPTMLFRGEAMPFNVPNCKTILGQMLWVREQVDAGVGDLENFMKN